MTTVRPELLGTEGAAPEDFGYESFGQQDDVIEFLVGVYVYDEVQAALQPATADFAAAQLMHVGIVWDASDESSPLKLYIDGVLQTPVFEDSVEPATSIAEAAAYIAAGHTHDLELHRASRRLDGAANQFDSEQFVDNLKIWSHAKSDFSDRSQAIQYRSTSWSW